MSSELNKMWPGKNRFFCRDRLVCGPSEDVPLNITTWVLILLISILYIVYVIPYIWVNITIYLPLLQIGLFTNTLIFLLLTQSTDPGIIPRKQFIKENSLETPYPELYEE